MSIEFIDLKTQFRALEDRNLAMNPTPEHHAPRHAHLFCQGLSDILRDALVDLDQRGLAAADLEPLNSRSIRPRDRFTYHLARFGRGGAAMPVLDCLLGGTDVNSEWRFPGREIKPHTQPKDPRIHSLNHYSMR